MDEINQEINNEKKLENIKQKGFKTTTVSIPYEIYEQIKQSRFKINDLVLLGFESKKENPVLINRLKESEENIQKLLNKVKELALRIRVLETDNYNLKTQVEKLETKNLIS